MGAFGAGPAAERGAAFGYAAMALAVAIWAGWIVLVRATVGPSLTPLDIALLRYGAPALALAPIWLRRGAVPRGVAGWRVAAMTLGWGAPFALFAAEGASRSSSTLFAALVPGTMPLWAALIALAIFGARPTPRARAGLALIAAAGVSAIAPLAAAGAWDALDGAPWLLAAAISWAAYAVAYRGSGLSPIEATAIVAFWSSLGLAPAALVFGTGLTAMPPLEAATQIVLHGIVSGIVSVVAFAAGLRALGAQRAAGFAALVPVLAALGGWAILGEAPAPGVALAIALAAVGVALVNTAPASGG